MGEGRVGVSGGAGLHRVRTHPGPRRHHRDRRADPHGPAGRWHVAHDQRLDAALTDARAFKNGPSRSGPFSNFPLDRPYTVGEPEPLGRRQVVRQRTLDPPFPRFESWRPSHRLQWDKSRAWRGGALALVRVGLPQFGSGRSLTTLAIRCSKPSWTSPLTDSPSLWRVAPAIRVLLKRRLDVRVEMEDVIRVVLRLDASEPLVLGRAIGSLAAILLVL